MLEGHRVRDRRRWRLWRTLPVRHRGAVRARRARQRLRRGRTALSLWGLKERIDGLHLVRKDSSQDREELCNLSRGRALALHRRCKICGALLVYWNLLKGTALEEHRTRTLRRPPRPTPRPPPSERQRASEQVPRRVPLSAIRCRHCSGAARRPSQSCRQFSAARSGEASG